MASLAFPGYAYVVGGYSAGSNETETAMANIHIKHHTASYRVHLISELTVWK